VFSGEVRWRHRSDGERLSHNIKEATKAKLTAGVGCCSSRGVVAKS